MVVAVLSPWPSTPAAIAAARTCLSDAIGVTAESALDRLGSTGAALVERYAPEAPAPVKNEAVIRAAGWLASTPAAAIRSESTGDVSTSYAPTHMGALRHSGAMALLTTWKIRRAGAI